MNCPKCNAVPVIIKAGKSAEENVVACPSCSWQVSQEKYHDEMKKWNYSPISNA